MVHFVMMQPYWWVLMKNFQDHTLDHHRLLGKHRAQLLKQRAKWERLGEIGTL
jgi:hypothetical protein